MTLEVLRSLYSLAHYCRVLARPSGGKKIQRKGEELAAPLAVRQFFSHASHINCHTTKSGKGTGTRHNFTHGEIAFKGVGGTTGVLNPRFVVVIHAS